MRLTRRKLLLAGGAGAVLAAGGVYELVDQLTGARPRDRRRRGLPPEQHVLRGVRLVEDNGVEVVVPPLHHQLVTANARGRRSGGARSPRRRRSSSTRCRSWRRSSSPSAGRARRHRRLGPAVLPLATSRSRPTATSPSTGARRRRRASRSSVLLDSRRFPSDPPETDPRGERRRGAPAQRPRSTTSPPASKAIFQDLDLFRATSIRKGFAGGGFDGGQSLPKQMAVAAQVPGSYLIPDEAELFLGFTSTQKAGLGPRRSPTSRSSASVRAATSPRGRTSPCRTSARISRPGTSTSRTRSGSRPSSGRG